MIIGNREFNNKTYIMGILNVTPDSFSDGGSYKNIDAALYRVQTMISEGADVIDVGGESTRPGYTKISDEEEISRVVPVIEAVKTRFDIPISIDTYKPNVCEQALIAGSDLVNDIWGFSNIEMAKVTKKYNASCCIMHNRSNTDYTCFFDDMCNDLKRSIDVALSEGIDKDKIMIDPGVGFAKNQNQNLESIKKIGELRKLGYPVLLGASRKSYIGNILGTDTSQRVEGTLASTAYAVMGGALFVRVHDILQNKRFITVMEEIRK